MTISPFKKLVQGSTERGKFGVAQIDRLSHFTMCIHRSKPKGKNTHGQEIRALSNALAVSKIKKVICAKLYEFIVVVYYTKGNR